jgi:NADH:ubiquinone oxidoreductase subunit
VSENRHYSCRITQPAKGSRYAFLLASFAINDTESKPPPWHGLMKITQDMPPAEQAYCKRWNQVLAIFESGFLKQATETVRRAFPEAGLDAPFEPGVEALMQDLMNGYRIRLKVLHDTGTDDILKRGRPFDGERYARELCVRVIVATGHALYSPGHRVTAKYLNGGTGERGLTRDHVGRARKPYDKMLERLIKAIWRSGLWDSALFAEFLYEDVELVRRLDVLYRDARARPEFKNLRGAELAEAIHAQRDINEMIHRAASLPRTKIVASA